MAKKKNQKIKTRSSPAKSAKESDKDDVFDVDVGPFDEMNTICSMSSYEDPGYGSKEDLNKSVMEVEDNFEDKLDALLDSLQSSKGAVKTRVANLAALAKAMGSRFCDEYFADR